MMTAMMVTLTIMMVLTSVVYGRDDDSNDGNTDDNDGVDVGGLWS